MDFNMRVFFGEGGAVVCGGGEAGLAHDEVKLFPASFVNTYAIRM